MKKLFKISSYILATLVAFLVSQASAFAAGDSLNKDSSSLSVFQVIGGLVLLLIVILLPLVKSVNKQETI